MFNTIAIVGRPNVGKSTLFNKIINKRIAIVHDSPGVTRDRIYGHGKWQNHEFKIIDTGGISILNETFQKEIQIQAQIAIEESQVIVFVVDGLTDLTNDDLFIANILKKSGKTILVAANKIESTGLNPNLYRIGFTDIFPISAMHGTGIGDLLDKATSKLTHDEATNEHLTKLTIIGKPNAGKSSLLNALTQEHRSIVSAIPGTTRDSVSSFITLKDQEFEIIDTAGILRKSKLVTSVDHYALLRAMNSLDDSDIALLVIDSQNVLDHFDSRIIGYALERNKPIILIINKWDLVKKEHNTMDKFTKLLKTKFEFASWLPIVYISATQNERLDKLKEMIVTVNENKKVKLKTSLLNEVLVDIITFKPPKIFNNGTLQIKHLTQVEGRIPTFVFFVNDKKLLHFSYKRYLENQLRQNFKLDYVPIITIFKNK